MGGRERRRIGGGINVVTKSGANTLHGDVFLFGQSGLFNASPKLESRPSVADFGAAYMGSNTHDQRYLELGDTVGHARGSHFLKAGFNARHVVVTGTTTDASTDVVIEAFNVPNRTERHPGEYRLRAASGITPIVRSSD